MSIMTSSPINNGIYIRRRSKVILPEEPGSLALPLNYVTSVMKNVEALGYTFSKTLISACQDLTLEALADFYRELIIQLGAATGALREFKPMYPNFPDQVMRMDEAQLYWNAIIHYLSGGTLKPRSEKKIRLPLLDEIKPKVIDLGSIDDFESLFGQIASSNSSLSEQDKEDLAWFVSAYGDDIARLMPETVPQKETIATLAGLLIAHTSIAEAFVTQLCKTATDVLRLAVGLSSGDVSLATSTRFRTFSRPERRLLLGLLDRLSNITEDMLRWKGRWIRLGEKLHPGEYADKYPNASAAFAVLRNDTPITTFRSQVEAAFAAYNVPAAVDLLRHRPGEFARRLDHLLRWTDGTQEQVIAAFVAIADKVSTPVLLQMRSHFQVRNEDLPLRVFFPKGSLAKAHAEPNFIWSISDELCARVVALCTDTLLARFHTLSPLGRVYVDPMLADYLVPFSARSASKSLRTVARGSRLPLPANCSVLRFFVWWHNGMHRTDIDLSAAMFDADFGYRSVLSYYNLKEMGGVHSGDIVDAPQGASEFIDITVDRVREQGIRYVVMVLNSYTRQPFVDLPECFAGWMARQEPGSGEIYEPRTVQDRLDLTTNTKIAIPLVIDLVDNKVIWCDMALTRNPSWNNHVHGNLSGIAITLQSLVTVKKSTLYDLFLLHAQARGELVSVPTDADIVFSVANETPYRQEEITSQYLV